MEQSKGLDKVNAKLHKLELKLKEVDKYTAKLPDYEVKFEEVQQSKEVMQKPKAMDSAMAITMADPSSVHQQFKDVDQSKDLLTKTGANKPMVSYLEMSPAHAPSDGLVEPHLGNTTMWSSMRYKHICHTRATPIGGVYIIMKASRGDVYMVIPRCPHCPMSQEVCELQALPRW